MIRDSRELPKDSVIEADVCIVGSGAAGITIARDLRNGPLSVCLVESGGLELDPEIQDLNRGEVLDAFFFDLEFSRLRMFGGTTNHWSGTSRPLGELTLRSRPGIDHSGWPISRSELTPYFAPAHELCRMMGPYEYGNYFWGEVALPAPIQSLTSEIYQRNYPVRFNEVYHDDLASAGNVTVWLHATALRIESDEAGRGVKALRVGRLGGEPFQVRAQVYVLAMGAVENARLLLLSDDVQQAGLGNGHDLVGRFLSDHPAMEVAELLPSDRFLDPRFFFKLRPERAEMALRANLRPRLALKPEVIEREQLNQYLFDLFPEYLPSEGVDSAKSVFGDMKSGRLPDDLFEHLGNLLGDFDDVIDAAYKSLFDSRDGIFDNPRPIKKLSVNLELEQSPNPDSRVMLSQERDAFGQRRAAVDWRMNGADLDRAKKAMEIFAAELGAAGLGRIRSVLHEDGAGWPQGSGPGSLYVGYHQMGTTRMSDDPRHGVVDRACRVHGLTNLYVAGGSVFPTVGHERPTLNIVALALRLADHIRTTLGGKG